LAENYDPDVAAAEKKMNKLLFNLKTNKDKLKKTKKSIKKMKKKSKKAYNFYKSRRSA